MDSKLARIALLTLAVIVSIIVALALLIYGRYGGGEPYPDLSSTPVLPASAMTEAARYDEPIGNLAVSKDGRLFFSVHPESRPERVKLLEWRNGKAVPYPSLEAQSLFDTVLGVAIDQRGRLWTVDHGTHGTRKPKLLAFDLATNEKVKEHAFGSEVAPLGSFLQDLNVSPDGRWAYVADVSFLRQDPGLVVVDLESGRERRALSGHESVSPQDWVVRNPIKDMVFFGGLVVLKPGVDGIAVSPDGTWLAYGAMTHDTMYRVSTADLQNFDLSDEEIAARIKAVGKKPLNDGLSIDLAGNILITDVEHGAVIRQYPDGRLETLVRDDRIRWADALSHGPGNGLYVADSAIPHQMLRSKKHIAENAPYFVWRIESDQPGAPGQ